MRKIFKVVPKFPYDRVQVPANTVPLTCQLQNNVPTVWYQFENDTFGHKTLVIQFVGTGHDVYTAEVQSGNYIGTVQQDGFVWHCFAWME